MQRFDEHVLLHAQVQSLHRAARRQQRLVGRGLLQLREAAGPGGEENPGEFAGQGAPLGDSEQESSDTYDKQPQSQVRGAPQSIPPRPSSHGSRWLRPPPSRAPRLSAPLAKQESWDANRVGPVGAFPRRQPPQGEPVLGSDATQRGARRVFNYRPGSGGLSSCRLISRRRRKQTPAAHFRDPEGPV